MTRTLMGMGLLLVCAGLTVAACGTGDERCSGVQCGPCPPALTVKVTAEGGGPVADASLVGEPGECNSTAEATVCTPARSESGLYEFDVSAPGFRTERVEQTVPEAQSGGCCACGYESKTVELTLQPE